ncbi:MAG: EAL domain-containing protein [Azonexus sp.]|nr:EAL domain-containing protein [Azonexus sp.]
MLLFNSFHSLRSKLIALTVAVELVMLSAIVWNSERLAEEHLTRQFELRRAEITSLLQAAIGPAMAQRDYAAVSDTLRSAQQLQGLKYLVMFDEEGQRVASANLARESPVPAVDAFNGDISRLEYLHSRIPVQLEGRSYGELQIGIDLSFLREVRQTLLTQNVVLAALGILISTLFLGALAHRLTRRLDLLTRASQDLEAGRPFTSVPGTAVDDLGTVVHAFNNMATALERRIKQLSDSEAEQRAQAEAIDIERSRLDALLAAMRIGLVFVSRSNQVAYLNPSFHQLWELDPSTLAAAPSIIELRTALGNIGTLLHAVELQTLFNGDGTQIEIELSDGRIITQHSVPVKNQTGGESGRLWIFEDITSERQIAERLIFMAERDPLTTLANRSRFDAELGRLMALRRRNPGISGALLYFDLDEFKYINDTYGHRAGDSVLVRTADVVGAMVRSNEVLARLGGDEFAIIVPGANLSSAQSMAERLIEAVSQMIFEFNGRRLGLTISLGIALFPEHGETAEELVSHADAAMYQAKHAGKNCWRLYRPDLDQSESMLAQLGWNEKIQTALQDGRFVLHFQGVHSCQTGAISHYEALVRMIDPNDPGNLLLPGAFIPSAERSGRIVDIDRWVMQAAIRKLAATPDLPALAINISARSFDDPSLAASISALLAEFHVEPRRLIVELTETAALSNMQDSERFISDIRALGCTVCLDDFGVGFSSFAYLKHLSADVLKIDGMFIRGLLTSKEDQVFVRAIVEVARGLGKKTVAEFVGDAETLSLLASLGVDYAQGFYLSRPVPEISAA